MQNMDTKLAMNSEKNWLARGANTAGKVQKILAEVVSLGGIVRTPLPS